MRRNIAGVILLVLAAVVAVGSVTFLGPCVHEDGSAGHCAKAGTAVLIAGCVLAVLAVLILAFRGRGIRTVLFIAAAAVSVIGILLPGTLYPLCKMDTMHCRAVMQPAMTVLFAAALAVSAAGLPAGKKRSGSVRG